MFSIGDIQSADEGNEFEEGERTEEGEEAEADESGMQSYPIRVSFSITKVGPTLFVIS